MPKASQTSMFFALRALSIVEGLTRSEARVAGALLAHYNHKTGRCDPSVSRLAALLGIGRATVLAATARLSSGPDRLFDKDSHGGHSNCAQCTPRWAQFRQIVEEFDAKFMAQSLQRKEQNLRRLRSEDLDVQSPETRAQTLKTNPPNKPMAIDGACGNAAALWPQVPPEVKTANEKKTGQKHGNGWDRRIGFDLSQHRQRPHIPVSHTQAARTAAERRLFDDLKRLGEEKLADATERLDEEIYNMATIAELGKRGAGIRFICERLWPRARAAPS